ncbi:hypothetical protein B0H13DRAFT_2456326 [Mycena leptocephala]|nr:hypothetical protein B0H13DRAFT_2456326 [Mycena leptocephala]
MRTHTGATTFLRLGPEPALQTNLAGWLDRACTAARGLCNANAGWESATLRYFHGISIGLASAMADSQTTAAGSAEIDLHLDLYLHAIELPPEVQHSDLPDCLAVVPGRNHPSESPLRSKLKLKPISEYSFFPQLWKFPLRASRVVRTLLYFSSLFLASTGLLAKHNTLCAITYVPVMRSLRPSTRHTCFSPACTTHRVGVHSTQERHRRDMSRCACQGPSNEKRREESREQIVGESRLRPKTERCGPDGSIPIDDLNPEPWFWNFWYEMDRRPRKQSTYVAPTAIGRKDSTGNTHRRTLGEGGWESREKLYYRVVVHARRQIADFRLLGVTGILIFGREDENQDKLCGRPSTGDWS